MACFRRVSGDVCEGRLPSFALRLRVTFPHTGPSGDALLTLTGEYADAADDFEATAVGGHAA
jgi:hypothetical protein